MQADARALTNFNCLFAGPLGLAIGSRCPSNNVELKRRDRSAKFAGITSDLESDNRFQGRQ